MKTYVDLLERSLKGHDARPIESSANEEQWEEVISRLPPTLASVAEQLESRPNWRYARSGYENEVVFYYTVDLYPEGHGYFGSKLLATFWFRDRKRPMITVSYRPDPYMAGQLGKRSSTKTRRFDERSADQIIPFIEHLEAQCRLRPQRRNW